MIAIEAMLCRITTRSRCDEDSLKYLKRTLETQSYSRLPKVRSIAKDLLHKMKNPELLQLKNASDLPLDNVGVGYSNSTPNLHTKLSPKVDKKDRIYISPPQQPTSQGNPYQLGSSFEGVKQSVASLQVSDSQGKAFEFASSQIGEKSSPQESQGLPVFAKPDPDPRIPPMPLLVSLPPDDQPAQVQVGFSAVSFAGQNDTKTATINKPVNEEEKQDVGLQSSPQLRLKRDEMKLKKMPLSSQKHGASVLEQEHGEIQDLKRGIYLIEDPLLKMTKGKGWGPNIRAKNYLKKYSGSLQYEHSEDQTQSDRLQERREQRSKHRNELNYLIGKNKQDSKSNSRSPAKFNLLDETGEKKRKRRLLLISKGLDPDDPLAEDKLKAILAKEEEEANNVFLKSNLISSDRKKPKDNSVLEKELSEVPLCKSREKSQV